MYTHRGSLGRYLPGGNYRVFGRNDFSRFKIRGFPPSSLGEIEGIGSANILRYGMRSSSHVRTHRQQTAGPLNTTLATKKHLAPVQNSFYFRAHLFANSTEACNGARRLCASGGLAADSQRSLDRKALPMPETGMPIATRAYEAPQGETETFLSTESGRSPASARASDADPFFQLGAGHSLWR